jgi:hypothetical protein
LVLHEMVGVIGDRQTGIITDFAEWHIGGTDKTIGKFASTDGGRDRGVDTGGSLGVGRGSRTSIGRGRHLT